MEYSIWHQKVTVWSTPYGNIYSQMELILKHSIRHQKCARWSTPYGHYLMPYGVLHTVTIYCLMEYSIWSLWSSHFHVSSSALTEIFAMLSKFRATSLEKKYSSYKTKYLKYGEYGGEVRGGCKKFSNFVLRVLPLLSNNNKHS